MTKAEAHRILDEARDRTKLHPYALITRALWTTGDAQRTLRLHAEQPRGIGIQPGNQGIRLAESQGS